MKMKCSQEMVVVMVVSLSLVSQAAQPGIHWGAGQKTQLGKAPASLCGLERRPLLTSGGGGHLDCTQMDGSFSYFIGSDTVDLLVSVPESAVQYVLWKYVLHLPARFDLDHHLSIWLCKEKVKAH